MRNKHDCPDDCLCVVECFVDKSRRFLEAAVPVTDSPGHEQRAEDGANEE